MTYGVFVELELKDGSTLWGFIAPEKLKRQHQSWRGEEGNLKAYVKKDALKLAQELKVRVLPTSAMSHFVCISASGKCLRIGHGDFNRKKYDSDHGISSCAILRQTLHVKGVLWFAEVGRTLVTLMEESIDSSNPAVCLPLKASWGMLAVHGQHFDDPWRFSTEMGDVCFVKWDPGPQVSFLQSIQDWQWWISGAIPYASSTCTGQLANYTVPQLDCPYLP